MPAPTCCTVKPGAWGQRDPASFLSPQGSFPPVLGLLEHIPCGWINAKPSGTMEASVVFTDSEKGGSLVSRGLTSSSFFACQGGTVAAQMNPKEEEVTIITEVSPRGLGVGGHCAPVTGAGEGGTSGSSRWVSRTHCMQTVLLGPGGEGRGCCRDRGRAGAPAAPAQCCDTARSARQEFRHTAVPRRLLQRGPAQWKRIGP